MSSPTQLDPEAFFGFVASPGPAVLLLSIHRRHQFSAALCDRLNSNDRAQVSFAQMSFVGLATSSAAALEFLRHEILASAASVPVAIPPGYYLFQHGRML